MGDLNDPWAIDEWPAYPEMVPLYGVNLGGSGLPVLWNAMRPVGPPPFEVMWVWRWKTCGMWLASSGTQPTEPLVCQVVPDFTCPVHTWSTS